MALIADGLLIATCLTTAIYCFVLSRRLRRLSDTGAGIGKQILQMNAALEETRAALADIRRTSKSTADELARETAHARRATTELRRLLKSVPPPGTPATALQPAGNRYAEGLAAAEENDMAPEDAETIVTGSDGPGGTDVPDDVPDDLDQDEGAVFVDDDDGPVVVDQLDDSVDPGAGEEGADGLPDRAAAVAAALAGAGAAVTAPGVLRVERMAV